MPYKRRLGTRADLGSVTADTFSDEVDLSSSTHCVLFVSQASATSFDIEVWFSPTPFGEAASWYRFYQSVASLSSTIAGDIKVFNLRGTEQVHPVPPAYVHQQDPGYEISFSCVPQRAKFKPATTCSLFVEGSRRIT